MENSMKQIWRLFIVSFLVVLFLANDAVSQNPRNNGGTNTSEEKLKVIDAHTHGYEREDGKEAGVVGVVAMPSANGKIQLSTEKNAITCLGLVEPIDLKSVEADLKQGYGCIKIFLGYPLGEKDRPIFRYAYDAVYKGVYKLAAQYDVPVVFHTGDPQAKLGKIKYADPLTIDEVAVDNRGTTFVIAHCGNPWYQTAAEVAYKNKNVFLECSALLTGNVAVETKDKTKEEIEEKEKQVNLLMIEPIKWVFTYIENPRKLMFGSDFGPVTNIKSYMDAYKKAIPEKHWKAVFSENAACVYKFNKKFPADFGQVKCKQFWDSFKNEL
jgi:hypothetical protein